MKLKNLCCNDRFGFKVVQGGFEPPQTEPKPVVLPLHHWTIACAKVRFFCSSTKFYGAFFIRITFSAKKESGLQAAVERAVGM